MERDRSLLRSGDLVQRGEGGSPDAGDKLGAEVPRLAVSFPNDISKEGDRGDIGGRPRGVLGSIRGS